jgi:pimeloyl-ACP methyl ester carboxylesterase
MKEKFIKAEGIEICTESFGDENNPAILLLAGATVSMLFWDTDFCIRLAENGYLVIRYDNRDVGKSTSYTPGTTPYNIVDLTDDAIAILDGYKIEKAHFVGISLGGLIAQISAIRFPGRVHSLTLMSTGPWGDSDSSIPEMDTRILDFHSKADSVDWTSEDSVTSYLIQGAQLMSGRKPFEEKRSENRIRNEFNRANNYISMFNHATLGGGEDYWNRLSEINMPTLIVHGTDDKIWHFQNTAVLKTKIKGSKLITLEGTGHELHTQDWPAIVDEINRHISDCEE